MLTADVIVGGFFGDEGKGKYVGGAGHDYDAVLRVNASTNAGHCVVSERYSLVTRQLPSVFFPARTQLVIAPGALVNPVALAEELTGRPDVEQLRGKLKVASSVALVIRPYREKGRGPLSKLIGSTHQGTGPTAVARAARHALRLYDLRAAASGDAEHVQRVREKLVRTCGETLPLRFVNDSPENEAYYDEVLAELVEAFKKIEQHAGDFCVDYNTFVTQLHEGPDKRLLVEGCNGLLLDNLHGALPHVTSTSTNIGALICGANLSPKSIDRIIVIIAAYCTCLGRRPFPTEMSSEQAAHFFANCNEVDVAEHNRRRIGWFDLPAYRKSLSGCQGAELHMNKLDVLTGLEQIKICTHYLISGKRVDILPDDPILYAKAEPQYLDVDGWHQPLEQARTFSALPAAAQRYVQLLERELPNQIKSVGVGPKNDQVIQVG